LISVARQQQLGWSHQPEQSFSVYPETPDNTGTVFDLETSNFLQGQGNQGFERRRSSLRRTIKSAD
jgi:hypothetical protein